jgi:hypothetical protein
MRSGAQLSGRSNNGQAGKKLHLKRKDYEDRLRRLHVRREKSQMYVQRYVSHLPAGGEIVIFDRSWYNRAGVGRKVWKLSKMDLESFARWDDYTRARDDMFMATDTAWAPSFVVRSDDKRRARLNIIEQLLASIPYKRVPRVKISLPKRRIARAGGISRLPLKVIAEVH